MNNKKNTGTTETANKSLTDNQVDNNAANAKANSASQKTDGAPGNADTSGNTIKDPDDWSTGDEAMTGAQRSYLHTLATEAGEEPEEGLTKAEASKRIDELQHKTGRGLQNKQ